ncbi:MAG: AAA family ATPase [Acidimicrobiia bacterium]
MRRPAELFDRDHEWGDLDAFATQPGPGLRLALVRGRRRQGKSFLLRRLAAAAGGFYHQALEGERGQALAGFGQALGAHLAVPGGRLSFEDWDAALRAVAELPGRKGRPALAVIDEFPYLLTHSPELPSVLQRVLDTSRDGGPPVRLVVCGSALSVMAKLLTGAQALRGRATLDVVMRTFDYRDAARFWQIQAPPVAFIVHAVLGGTPGYRDLLPARPPARVADLTPWLAAGPLNPASAIFREDDYLLTEQRSLVDRALYHAVVTAIAAGHTSQGAIAAALGREQRAVQHPLRALEEAGFVDRHDDVLRSRRPIYRLADPIVRFHHVVTRPDLARFEDRRTTEAWADAQSRFATHVLGPHFEDLARTFAFRFASPETIGGEIAHVGAAVINDPKGRAQHEIDIIAVGPGGADTAPVAALGEAKHTTAPRTVGDLNRLERLRTLIGARRPDALTAKLLLFCAGGFDRNLVRAAATRADVELIDLDRLYTGQ